MFVPARKSGFDIRVCILPVLFCAFAILNSKFRAAMQTSETHNAFLFYPYSFFVLHFNCLHGTIFCAKTAPDTIIFHYKIRGASCPFVIYGLCYHIRDKKRRMRCHMLVLKTLPDLADNIVDLRFCVLGKPCDLLGRRQIKDRRPCVGHFNRIKCIDIPAANCPVSHLPRCARCCSVSRDKVKIIGFKRGFFEELLYDTWQPPEICRRDHTYHFIFKRIFIFSDTLCNGQHFLLKMPRKP